jgi:hypothetical protein
MRKKKAIKAFTDPDDYRNLIQRIEDLAYDHGLKYNPPDILDDISMDEITNTPGLLLPLYNLEGMTKNDIARVGHKMAPGGHKGVSVEEYDAAPDEVGYSGLGVNWEEPDKEKRKELLREGLNGVDRGHVYIGTAEQTAHKAREGDFPAEHILPRFRPEQHLELDNEPYDERRKIEELEKGLSETKKRYSSFMYDLGLRPKYIKRVLEGLKYVKEGWSVDNVPVTNRRLNKALATMISKEQKKQREDDLIEEFVNRRPTRTASDERVKRILGRA